MGIKINFTEEEVKDEGRSAVYKPLPTGDYPVYVSDVELKEVSKGQNQGKFYLAITLTVDDEGSSYNNRKLWTNIMLFEIKTKDGRSANWKLPQFINSTGNGHMLESGD